VESGIFGTAFILVSRRRHAAGNAHADGRRGDGDTESVSGGGDDFDRRVLTQRARGQRCPHRDVQRARIVLAAAEGHTNAAIAHRRGICVDTVRKWRARYCAEGLAGPADRPRPGRQRNFSAAAEAEVKALACALPAETGVPLARWSSAELAAEAVTRGLVLTVSASTVGHWLAADAIRPWRHHSWIFPRDPDFAVKAARVLDLYARICNGQPSARRSTCSAPTKRPSCRRCPGATGIYRRRRGAFAGPSSNTAAAAPWPIWPPTTRTPPGCSGAPRRPPASPRSPSWSSR
jgi:transposase